MTSPNVFTITDTTFATDILQSLTPVLVDFRGEWCRPCKIALAYGVRSPTMILFKGGKVQATQMGLVSKSQLTKIIDAL